MQSKSTSSKILKGNKKKLPEAPCTKLYSPV
jgi:hypothetical protein